MDPITTEGLRKNFGNVTALRNLTLSVGAGELFGFLGPNGAGKTTTITILTGQLIPDGGEASVLGVDPVTEPVAVRRKIGILPEQETPPSFMTPREYFSFVGTVRNLPDDTVEERAMTWADRLGFTEKFDTLCTDLSRGQQQKVMITQTFLHQPELVFIDEPLVNLDPIVQERFKRHLTEYTNDGNTIFLSTHDIDVAESLCSRVGIVSKGELVTTRRPDDLDAEESLLDVFFTEVGDQSAAGDSLSASGNA